MGPAQLVVLSPFTLTLTTRGLPTCAPGSTSGTRSHLTAGRGESSNLYVDGPSVGNPTCTGMTFSANSGPARRYLRCRSPAREMTRAGLVHANLRARPGVTPAFIQHEYLHGAMRPLWRLEVTKDVMRAQSVIVCDR